HGLEIMFEGVGICEQCRGLNVVDVHHPCGLTNALMKSEKARTDRPPNNVHRRSSWSRDAWPSVRDAAAKPATPHFEVYGRRSRFSRGEMPAACTTADTGRNIGCGAGRSSRAPSTTSSSTNP